jgi:Rrf2 family transcriptional regulator, nitric oxide-sensitive transcriptional repressor
MRLTIRTNLALRALMFCAVNHPNIVRKNDIAERCNTSPNHMAQVVNMLGQQGFVRTVRGRGGGIRLAHRPEDISVGAVMRAFESDVPFAECFANGANCCPITPYCRLKEAFSGALGAFYGHLDGVMIADLVRGNPGLRSLLALDVPARVFSPGAAAG